MTVGCSVCLSSDHSTGRCLSYMEDDEQANFIGGSSSPQLPPGWIHQSRPLQSRYSQSPIQYHYDAPQHHYFQHPQVAVPQQADNNSQPSLEDLVKTLVQNQLSFQDETRMSLQNLEGQIFQFANLLNELETRDDWVCNDDKVESDIEEDFDLGNLFQTDLFSKESLLTSPVPKYEMAIPSPYLNNIEAEIQALLDENWEDSIDPEASARRLEELLRILEDSMDESDTPQTPTGKLPNFIYIFINFPVCISNTSLVKISPSISKTRIKRGKGNFDIPFENG